MTTNNYQLTEATRSMRAAAADLRGRGARLEQFAEAVEGVIEISGDADFRDPRMAFFDNVVHAFEDAGRTQQFDQHERSAIMMLHQMYATEYAALKAT